MSGFLHYLLTLLSGHRRWHVLLLVLLLAQLIASVWFLRQQQLLATQHIEQLFELNRLSAPIANHAVAISQLNLNELEKLTAGIERYQQTLDMLKPVYLRGAGDSRQLFKRLNDIWYPIREAATDLLIADEKLQDLRAAVEDTDQRLPQMLAEHDRISEALRAALRKPASLRLLREQRLILQRMAANINGATASVLSAVDSNARIALSGSIESDLFLLEKSLGILVADNKEALQAAKEDGSDVSLILKISAMAQDLTKLTESVRKVITSLPVMRDANKQAQLLVEDSGLLVKPVQQLIADRQHDSAKLGKELLWLYVSLAVLLLWLFYVAYCRQQALYAEKRALSLAKENLQTGVDSIARQVASFYEGDHSISVRSEAGDCQHLVDQINRMIAYVVALDKQVENDFLPLIKRLAQAETEMMASIDRQAKDIARLSAELNNVVSGQTSDSTELAGRIVQTQTQLQSMLKQIELAQQQLPKRDERHGADSLVNAVRQLRQHISDRLQSLAELSQRINLDVIDIGTSLTGRSGSDRALRRSVEQLQSLTGRYQQQVNDVTQLLNDMMSHSESLQQEVETEEATVSIFERIQTDTVAAVASIDQGMAELSNAIVGADRAQARHTEAISLILDDLQDGNQRLSVAVTESGLAIRQLDKLAAAQVKTLKLEQSEDDANAGSAS